MVDGHERDAIVQTPDICFVIEASTSRKREKAQFDAEKTDSLVKKIRRQGFAAQGILVRLHEPTTDQEAVATKYKSTLYIQSYDQFLSRLFNASNYLQLRLHKPFGSIQDPRSEAKHFSLPREYYVDIPIIESKSGRNLTAREISMRIRDKAARLVVLADFGSGKSMSMREVFHYLREDFLQRRHARFPIYINLRDHSGAKYPDEILERHARDLGISDSGELVRAWRAGYVDLLLDGFDEFAAVGWSAAPYKLRQIRQAVLEAVRKLISESPAHVGILIAGRQHYFDSLREMADALGTHNLDMAQIEALSEVTARAIVKKYGGGQTVPDWVPSRALLLSYLAAKDFLSESSVRAPIDNPRGHGWNSLLQMIGEREAKQHRAIDGTSVVMFLERLATLARASSDGLGSFSEEDLSSVFQETCGFPPDDAARILISRLPALASLAPESGRRRFIDPDIVDAARAGDIARMIASPYDAALNRAFHDSQHAMGSNGIDRLAFLVDHSKKHQSEIEIAAERATKNGIQIAALDLVQLMMAWSIDYSRGAIGFSDLHFPSALFDEDLPDLSLVGFWECTIDTMTIGADINMAHMPRFYNCLIGYLDGIATMGDLPPNVFHNCYVEQLANSVGRNADILNTDLPLAVKVLLTILNKLFHQAGSGRKENAFSRGLDVRARELVPEILEIVQSCGFAVRSRMRNQTVWLPRRDKGRRVTDIMGRPSVSTDELLQRVRSI